jgi:hypothetical protein
MKYSAPILYALLCKYYIIPGLQSGNDPLKPIAAAIIGLALMIAILMVDPDPKKGI